MNRPLLLNAALLFLVLALTSCSGDRATQPPPGKPVEASGILVSLEDMVPVDGGVTLVVEATGGARTTFTIPSFFTPEPAPEGRWELYRKVKTFEIGDPVRARGVPGDHGGLVLISLERGESR